MPQILSGGRPASVLYTACGLSVCFTKPASGHRQEPGLNSKFRLMTEFLRQTALFMLPGRQHEFLTVLKPLAKGNNDLIPTGVRKSRCGPAARGHPGHPRPGFRLNLLFHSQGGKRYVVYHLYGRGEPSVFGMLLTCGGRGENL